MRIQQQGLLEKVAADLMVRPTALDRLRTGVEYDRVVFPMYDGEGRVIGLRTRTRGGAKRSAKGSRNGLFVPRDLDAGEAVYLAEGPTDTAALLSAGVEAVGRPCCTGGVEFVMDLVRGRGIRSVVIVADSDDAGRAGAQELAGQVRLVCADVRVVEPPAAFGDARAWVIGGARREDLFQRSATAVPVGLELKGASR